MQNPNQSRLGRTRFPALGAAGLRVFASSSHWLFMLFMFVVIGHCNCFGISFGFAILNWKPFYWSAQMTVVCVFLIFVEFCCIWLFWFWEATYCHSVLKEVSCNNYVLVHIIRVPQIQMFTPLDTLHDLFAPQYENHHGGCREYVGTGFACERTGLWSLDSFCIQRQQLLLLLLQLLLISTNLQVGVHVAIIILKLHGIDMFGFRTVWEHSVTQEITNPANQRGPKANLQ